MSDYRHYVSYIELLGRKFYRALNKKMPELLIDNGVSLEEIEAHKSDRNVFLAGYTLAKALNARATDSDRVVRELCSGAEVVAYDQGNVTIFMEDTSLLAALFKSRCWCDETDPEIRFETFQVSVREGAIVDGVAIQPFLFELTKVKGRLFVVLSINHELIYSSPWDVFVGMLAHRSWAIEDAGRADGKHLHVHARIAAAFALYMIAEPDSVKEGIPDRIVGSDKYIIGKDMKKARRTVCVFRPEEFAKRDRKGCWVLSYWRHYRHPKFHKGHEGQMKRGKVKGHARGDKRGTPYTAQAVPPAPVSASPLQG